MLELLDPKLSARIGDAVRAGLSGLEGSPPPFKDDCLRFFLDTEGRAVVTALVPVGAGHRLPLESEPGKTAAIDDEMAGIFVDDLMGALPVVHRARRAISKLSQAVARRVHRTVKTGTSDARLKAVRASTVRDLNREDAIGAMRFGITFDRFSPTLEYERQDFEVRNEDEVRHELEQRLANQDERSRAYLRSRAPGVEFPIDEVAVALIATNGDDLVETLRRFEHVPSVRLQAGPSGTHDYIFLNNYGGEVQASMGLARGKQPVHWGGRRLHVDNSRRLVKLAVPGAPVSRISDHPAFTGRTIVSVEQGDKPGCCAIVLDSSLLRFDARDGSLTRMMDESEGTTGK